jgi:sodium transport system permease protein
MNWSKVKLIFGRELRDQLRDRRTLFTVVILPLVLYPLLGMSLIQMTQFMREHPTKIWVVGVENLPQQPALIEGGQIAEQWVGEAGQELMELQFSSENDEEFQLLVQQFKDTPQQHGSDLVDQLIQKQMALRDVDLAVFIPKKIEIDQDSGTGTKSGVYVFTNSASDKSKIAFERFSAILQFWQKSIFNDMLEAQDISVESTTPIQVAAADVAGKTEKRAAAWSKILPLAIMIWCLTGAFYPAVDLCAGEKERGTFETLLSSPAHRSDIAYGKLFTVMTFSIATAVLNLISMGVTGLFVMSRLASMGDMVGGMPAMGPPPVASIFWLLLALLPVSALFSAMSLAAAAFARSSKEGQYYLVPLIMICMPLMMLPMLPAAKLEMGTSLIPITGLMLLLRGLIEGNYQQVFQFGGPVVAVTLVCCWFSIRWVVNQFNSETVLFRASERFGVGLWVKQIMRERDEMPSIGHAILCAVLILVIKFFVGFAMQMPTSWFHFAKQTTIVLVVSVALPAIMMALVLTTRAGKALRLRMCRLPVAAAAILMAIMLHPLVMWGSALVMRIYPPSGDLMGMQHVMTNVMADAPSMLAVLCVFALAPAITEELAFRGFILSGLESMRKRWAAILLSALFFGAAHAVIQQSIITFVVGAVLGVIAVQTRSLIPCILFHATHNGLSVVLTQTKFESGPISLLAMPGQEGFQYAIIPGIVMATVGLALIVWFLKLHPEDEGKTWDRLPEWVRRFIVKAQPAKAA